MLLWGLLLLAVIIGISLLFGAPYVPTHQTAVENVIKVLGLRRGQVLVELGAGDGRIALAAAKKGIRVQAFEINPVLFWVARLRTWPYRNLVQVRLADFKSSTWDSRARAVYIFGDRFVMNYLARRLERWPRPIRVVSYGFELPGHQPSRQLSGLWRYDLPAPPPPAGVS